MDRPGFELPLLLAGGFRALIDELHTRLAERGHPRVRPAYGFALQAVGPTGATTSTIGRRLGVSKQAATKTVGRLADLGYVARQPDPDDGRATRVTLTPHGLDCLQLSAAIFADLRAEWAAQLGSDRVTALEDDLTTMINHRSTPHLADLPGWLR